MRAECSIMNCAKGWQWQLADRNVTIYSNPTIKDADAALARAQEWADKHNVQITEVKQED